MPDENKDLYNVVFKRLLDLGDFIGIEGFVFRTQMGEIFYPCTETDCFVKIYPPASYRKNIKMV